MKTKDTKRKTRTGAVRRIGALLLALTMTFGTWTPAFAEEPAPVIEEPAKVETPVNEETEKVIPEAQETPAQDKADGLEIGPEIVEGAVGAPEIDTNLNPTVTTPKVGEKEVSGRGMQKDIKAKPKKAGTIHVLVKGEDGVQKGEEKTFVGQTTSNSRVWKVTLDQNLEKGDKIEVWQDYDGKRSATITVEPEPSLADTHKDDLKMPEGEIWIEQTSSSIVNDDEQAEALRMLKEANPDIADHITSEELKINGTTSASFAKINYDDKSIARDVPAPSLTIRQVTDTSRGTILNPITVVDKVITGKLEGEGPFDNIKVQIVPKLSTAGQEQFCEDGKCTVDKDSSNAISATVNPDGTFSCTLGEHDELKMGQFVGVSVKEKNKFISCSKTTVGLPTVDKTEVRDPHKLTAEDKKAIDAAIRKAYTDADGNSKLPNGTGDWGAYLRPLNSTKTAT